MKRNDAVGQWLTKITRRRFFRSAGAAVAVATTGFSGVATADDVVRLDENDVTAKALKYVHDARSVDSAMRSSNQYCNNCALFAGDSDDDWAVCSIFPGKAVSGQGWCSVWAPKQTS